MARRSRVLAAAGALALASSLLAACATTSSGGAASPTASGSPSNACTKASLATLTPGKLTIATGQPAYAPWVVDDKPESGKGFEAAVAYAVAQRLGYANDEVTWTRTTFDSAVLPGQKPFDFNIQQFSISEDRKKAVDFSSGYYDVSQVVVSYEGSPIAGAKTVADLKAAKLGAAVGTTSLTAIEEQIKPTQKAAVFNDNAAAVTALKNKQIDGIVVDLPTGFYLRDAEIDKGVIVGQLPATSGTPEQLGLLMAKGSPLTTCVTRAVDTLRADGTLQRLADQWLAGSGAPALQ